jgi:hypothetical protein
LKVGSNGFTHISGQWQLVGRTSFAVNRDMTSISINIPYLKKGNFAYTKAQSSK